MANFNEMDNFDDMYNEPPDFVAGFSGPQGLKRKASLDWNSYSNQSTSTSATGSSSRQFTSASTAETASHEISALDIKRRAVLDWNWTSGPATGPSIVPPPPPPPPLPTRPGPELSADEIASKGSQLQTAKNVKANPKSSGLSRKIYVSGLPPNLTEKPLFQYFSNFGPIHTVNVVRDKQTGISRGFGFVTFMCETDAEVVLNTSQHVVEGKPIRVNAALESGQDKSLFYDPRRAPKDNWMDSITLPPDQTRIYVGPLDDDVIGSDLQQQFVQFGAIRGVSRLKSSETSVKKCYGFIDFVEPKSMMRAFGSKIFVKGKHVRVALSRFAMEVILSNTVVYFYDAHLFVDESSLEKYFSQFGQVFRTLHFSDPITNDGVKSIHDLSAVNKNYGYVDFIKPESAKMCVQQRSQLIPPAPGQFVRLGEHLPTVLLYDLMSISEKDADKIVKRLEKNVPEQGAWGSCHPSVKSNVSQVRVPASMVSKLIGERGKTISEICRDSKTKITIPKVRPGDKHVVIQIAGGPDDIKVAQYLMQKILKGNR